MSYARAHISLAWKFFAHEHRAVCWFWFWFVFRHSTRYFTRKISIKIEGVILPINWISFRFSVDVSRCCWFSWIESYISEDSKSVQSFCVAFLMLVRYFEAICVVRLLFILMWCAYFQSHLCLDCTHFFCIPNVRRLRIDNNNIRWNEWTFFKMLLFTWRIKLIWM